MKTDARTSFRRPEEAPIDLSPAAVARYRILAEQERNKAVVSLMRRVFGVGSASTPVSRRSPLPAE